MRVAWDVLLSRLAVPAGSRILVLHATAAAPIEQLAASAAQLVVQAASLPDCTNLSARRVPRTTVTLEAVGAIGETYGTFDFVVTDADPMLALGNEFARSTLAAALRLVASNGTLWLVGSKRRGIETLERDLPSIATVSRLLTASGCRLLRLTPTGAGEHAESLEPQREITFDSHSHSFRLRLEPGVFSAQRLDEATELLLTSLKVMLRDDVLDLGCGAGPIGLVTGHLARKGTVTMVDSSPMAIRLAQQNVALNGLANADVRLSDGYSALAGKRFTLIATNPPFHRDGKTTTSIAERFIREAPKHLRPDGRLYVVANVFLKHDLAAKQAFAEVQEVARTARYRVLLCTGPIGARGALRRSARQPEEQDDRDDVDLATYGQGESAVLH